jgi:ring-1,2-phenylacetyl-CoA epoxidase subunit PaaD
MVTKAAGAATREEVFELLTELKDPELPVVDIVELGIVRDVSVEGDVVRVDVTPTYSGCPALQVIEQEIVATLKARGFSEVIVRNVFAPAWTTDCPYCGSRNTEQKSEFGSTACKAIHYCNACDQPFDYFKPF